MAAPRSFAPLRVTKTVNQGKAVRTLSVRGGYVTVIRNYPARSAATIASAARHLHPAVSSLLHRCPPFFDRSSDPRQARDLPMTDPNSLQAEPGSKSSTRQPPGTATSHARGAAEALMPEGRAAPQREIRNQTPYRIAIG